jgi:hypothetical protein
MIHIQDIELFKISLSNQLRFSYFLSLKEKEIQFLLSSLETLEQDSDYFLLFYSFFLISGKKIYS